MSQSTFDYNKNSDPPPSSWQDDGRVNLLLFANVKEFQAFLAGVGITTTVINGGAAMPKGNQVAGLMGTYVQLIGLIALSVLMGKHCIAKDMGVKKGHTGKLKFDQSEAYLCVFNNASWYLYYQGTIKANHHYHFSVGRDTIGKLS